MMGLFGALAAGLGPALTAVPVLVPSTGARAAQSRLEVLVIGDSLGHEIGVTLSRMAQSDGRFAVVNRGRASTGLVRTDFYDWAAAAERLLAERRFDAVVVSVGMNDQQNIAQGGEIHQRLGESWRRIYRERAEDLMARLSRAGAQVYWMGLPSARNGRFSQGMRTINGLFEAAAAAEGVVLVPVWDLTVDDRGRYIERGAAEDGRSGRIRADDGMHFTTLGYDIIVRRLIDTMSGQLAAAAAP